MYNEDIDGSIAHVTMLGKQGIVSEEEKEKIIAGLEEIRKDIADGKSCILPEAVMTSARWMPACT